MLTPPGAHAHMVTLTITAVTVGPAACTRCYCGHASLTTICLCLFAWSGHLSISKESQCVRCATAITEARAMVRGPLTSPSHYAGIRRNHTHLMPAMISVASAMGARLSGRLPSLSVMSMDCRGRTESDVKGSGVRKRDVQGSRVRKRDVQGSGVGGSWRFTGIHVHVCAHAYACMFACRCTHVHTCMCACVCVL